MVYKIGQFSKLGGRVVRTGERGKGTCLVDSETAENDEKLSNGLHCAWLHRVCRGTER